MTGHSPEKQRVASIYCTAHVFGTKFQQDVPNPRMTGLNGPEVRGFQLSIRIGFAEAAICSRDEISAPIRFFCQMGPSGRGEPFVPSMWPLFC